MDYHILLESFWNGIFTFGMLRHIYTDWQELLLYDSVNIYLAGMGLLRALLESNLVGSVLGALACGAVMLLIYLLSRGGMGEGDVKLAAVLGLWLGVEQGLACLLLAFIGGALVGGLLLALHKVERKQALPFGPCLCVSGLLMYFFGSVLLPYYWQLIR